MQFITITGACFIGLALAKDYYCQSSKGKFTIKESWAQWAMGNGSTDINTPSGDPHTFSGNSGAKGGPTYLTFYGADPRCNKRPAKLLDFPVMKDGSPYNKMIRLQGGPETPARVIYTPDGQTLCGVITHSDEDDRHHGSGPFRVCDPH